MANYIEKKLFVEKTNRAQVRSYNIVLLKIALK